MRIERPHQPTLPSSVERFRSNISSKIPIIHRPTTKLLSPNNNNDSYDLSYRRPLLHSNNSWDGVGMQQQWETSSEEEDEEEEEVDDVTPLAVWKKKPMSSSPRLLSSSSSSSPTSTAITAVKRPVKKVLSVVTRTTSVLPLRHHHHNASNYSYSPKYSDDNNDNDGLESRDDDESSQYLLRSSSSVMQAEENNTAGAGGGGGGGGHRVRQHFHFGHKTAKEERSTNHEPQQQNFHRQGSDSNSNSSSSMKNFKLLHHHDGNMVDFGGFDNTNDDSSPSCSSIDNALGSSSSLETDSSSSSSEKENTNKIGSSLEVAKTKSSANESFVSNDSEATRKRKTSMGESNNPFAELLSLRHQEEGRQEVLVIGNNGNDNGVNNNNKQQQQQQPPPMRLNTDESLVGLKISQAGGSSSSSSGGLRISDSSSDGTTTPATTNFRMSDSSDLSLAGLKISNSQLADAAFTDADAGGSSTSLYHRSSSAYASSIFGYSTDTNGSTTSLGSLVSTTSSTTIDLDSHLLTVEERIAGSAPLLVSPMDNLERVVAVEEEGEDVNNKATPRLVMTPGVESSIVTTATTGGQQSYVTYATQYTKQHPCPVTVTPTENGDVILLTPMEDVVDIGRQQHQERQHGSKTSSALLLLPSLLGSVNNEEEREEEELLPALQTPGNNDEERENVDATQIKTITRKKVAFWEEENENHPQDDDNEASPTGVDELPLFVSGDEELSNNVGYNNTVHEKKFAGGKRINMLELPSKSPLLLPSSPSSPLASPSASPRSASAVTPREDAEFIASDDWNDTDGADSFSYSSNPFGSCTVHDDIILLQYGAATPIQLRPSLESDCCASSYVSSSIAQTSDCSDGVVTIKQSNNNTYNKASDNHNRCLLDMVADEEQQSKGSSKETSCASLGSFNQIYNQSNEDDPHYSNVEEEDSDDSECGGDDYDKPGDYFDYSNGDDAVDDAPQEDDDDDYNFINDLVHQKSILLSKTKSRPWAKRNDDSDSDSEYCGGSDLVSAPSNSFSSSLGDGGGSSQDDDASSSSSVVVHLVSSGKSGEDAAVGITREESATSSSSSSSSDDTMKDFDKLNNFWVHEWTEMAGQTAGEDNVVDAAAEEEDGASSPTHRRLMSDPDSNQPHFLLKRDVGDSMDDEEEDEEEAADKKARALSNICSDCDGNSYLRIYDLDSRADVYEVIQSSHSLETVKECSWEEEEEEEEGSLEEEENARNAEVPRQPLDVSLKELDALWSKIDEYQSTLAQSEVQRIITAQASPSLGQEFRTVNKSSKKRRYALPVVKKRAIIKARSSEKAKYDLAYLEKASHHENKGPHHHKTPSIEDGVDDKPRPHAEMTMTPHRLSMDASLDGILAKALGALTEYEQTEGSTGPPKEVDEDEELAILKESTVKNVAVAILKESNHSLASSSISDDDSLSSSWDMDEDPGKDAVEESLKGAVGDDGSDNDDACEQSERDDVAKPMKGEPSSRRPELKRGQSVILAKLYDENVELAETLAATQTELEKVSTELERVYANARFEI